MLYDDGIDARGNVWGDFARANRRLKAIVLLSKGNVALPATEVLVQPIHGRWASGFKEFILPLGEIDILRDLFGRCPIQRPRDFSNEIV